MKSRRLVAASFLPLTMVLSACGSGAEADTIATAVAQTVSAQERERASFTPTPLPPSPTPPMLPTLTPAAAGPTPTRQASATSSCASASWLGDTPPDGKIMKPGEQFWKTWTIRNTSSCTWNTSYQIVFWDGNVMGGGYVYNFPQSVLPGNVVEIPLLLTAPLTDGQHVSEWKFKTPDGTLFGVGEYSVPISAVIEVSSDANPDYGIVSVDYTVSRDPQYGCPANVWYTVTATITTNGPLEFTYYWAQWDGNDSNTKTVEVKEAGTTTLSRQDARGLATNPGEKWMQLVFTDPAFPTVKAFYYHNCNL